MLYEIPNHVKDNILVFLKRSQLTGEEVDAFNEVRYILNNPIKQSEPESIKDAEE